MPTLESNRVIVLRFCELLSCRDFAGMAELVTSDATWWVVGRPDYARYGGLRRITEVLRVIDGFFGTLDRFVFTVGSSIAEGDCVAIEATSCGTKGAASYNNVYLMRFQLRDGKIHAVREFFDAHEITAYLQQLGVGSSAAFGGNRSRAGNAPDEDDEPAE